MLKLWFELKITLFTERVAWKLGRATLNDILYREIDIRRGRDLK